MRTGPELLSVNVAASRSRTKTWMVFGARSLAHRSGALTNFHVGLCLVDFLGCGIAGVSRK